MRASWKAAGHAFSRPRTKDSQCRVCRNLHFSSTETPESSESAPASCLSNASRIPMDLYDLAESADSSDCLWCALVYRGLLEMGAELPQPGDVARVVVVAQVGRPLYVDWITTHQRIAAEIYQLAGYEPCIQKLGTALDVRPVIDSDHTFEMIRGWIERCDITHDNCKPRVIAQPHPPRTIQSSVQELERDVNSNGALEPRGALTPRRLIDVGDPSQPESKRVIRLVADVKEGLKYIALSHCWGSRQAFTTTRYSLSQRLKAIRWEDLPKTYQDSIIVARRLNVRHLWIDSLCIVQDDSADWAAESVKMGGIYESSYLTIAAALAEGDDVGFLGSSSERMDYESRQVDLSDFGKGDQVRVRKIHDYRTIRTRHCLYTRAWTLQEALLPPRLLTFSVTVFFECREGDACECGSGLLPDPFCGTTNVWHKLDRSAYARMTNRELGHIELYKYWWRTIVAEYSRRQLTRVNDRIPALHAMITEFSRVSNDANLAGLWRKNMAFDLAWWTGQRLQPMPQRAPSWSWASVEGAVLQYADAEKMEPTLDLLDADVSISAMGELEQGRLEISAPACWAHLVIHWMPENGEYRMRLRHEKDKLSNVPPDAWINLDSHISIITANGSKSGRMHKSFQRTSNIPNEDPASYGGVDGVGATGAVLCVLLSKTKKPVESGGSCCFLLLGSDPCRETTFHRLGLFVYLKKLNMEDGVVFDWIRETERQTIWIE